MKPSSAAAILSHAVTHQLPVLLVGAPGVGKSDLVAQAAAAPDADLVLSHPALQDPTDFGGIPWPDAATGQARFLPIAQVHQLLAATRTTVWFLDDLGQAPPAVQASCMQWLLAREVHGMRLPDCVTILAATNRRQDRAGVSGILEPVKSRFSTIIEITPDLDDWCRWALTNGVHPDIVAFLRYRPALLSTDDPPGAEIVNRPSPRTWAFLAKWHGAGLPAFQAHAVYSGSVGEGAATELQAFLALQANAATVDEILIDPAGARLPDGPAQMYAVASGLAYRANTTTVPRIAAYLRRMHQANMGEYVACSLKDSVRRFPAIVRTPEWMQMMSDPDLAGLILGLESEPAS